MNRILLVLAAASLSIALPCFASLPPGVTATPANSPWDRIWGTDIYTIDSALAKSAAHVSATIGVKSYVKVTILAGQASYANTTRNGISSESWERPRVHQWSDRGSGPTRISFFLAAPVTWDSTAPPCIGSASRRRMGKSFM